MVSSSAPEHHLNFCAEFGFCSRKAFKRWVLLGTIYGLQGGAFALFVLINVDVCSDSLFWHLQQNLGLSLIVTAMDGFTL